MRSWTLAANPGAFRVEGNVRDRMRSCGGLIGAVSHAVIGWRFTSTRAAIVNVALSRSVRSSPIPRKWTFRWAQARTTP